MDPSRRPPLLTDFVADVFAGRLIHDSHRQFDLTAIVEAQHFYLRTLVADVDHVTSSC